MSGPPPLRDSDARRLTTRLAMLHRPLAPMPTGLSPRLVPMTGLRAALFDVYGTLLCSASGDVDAAPGMPEAEAMRAALKAAGIAVTASEPETLAARLHAEIAREHARLRDQGVAWPEVRIEECWARLLPRVTNIHDVAVEFEARMNPVWPLPGVRRAFEAVRSHGLLRGIVSNAQFYTPLTLAAFDVFSWPEEWPPDLCLWSFDLRRGKPDPSLFLQARRALDARGIRPRETLFIGNDLAKDIRPAHSAGFRTALYAGDARSLRLHDGRPEEAEIVLTDWSQLPDVLF